VGIEYLEAMPPKAQYWALFQSTAWNEEYRLSEDELWQAIQQSWFLVAAYDTGRLVGSGRIVSDGVLHALIVDVIVLPEYQRRGIGAAIMRRLVERCRHGRIRDVQLFCARGKAAFYERLGFGPRPADAPGMDFKPAE
jgi:GNAT superfamily N-acetyltransferase